MMMRKMWRDRAKHLSMGSALVLCLGAAGLVAPKVQAQQAPSSGERQTLDRIVAVVNDGAIMHSELEKRLDRVINQIEAQGSTPPPREQLEEQVLERMVVEEIQLQMARDANLSVDETELNRQVRAIAESNGMSLEAFADRLEEDGTSLAQVREEVRRELLMRQVQQRQIGQRVSVDERDIERFLSQQSPSSGDTSMIEETRVRHILVEINPTRDEEQARARALQARERVMQGEDFASVARDMSDDGGSALSGGSLGWLRPGQTVPAFEQAMSELEPGEVSAPVRSQFGYHVIEVLDRRREDVSDEARREQVRQAIFQRRANEEMGAWQQEIRSQAFVDIRL
ncbi:peptidylprolyl isomerase [Halomonas alkaliantarctica]|nr:peptidylprolyl isomerase [Halomonas alkaliantarctica]